MLNLILLDSREPQSILTIDYGVMTLTQELKVGDAWLACDDATVIVERKTAPDLLDSISDNRLFNQAAEMRQESPWSYLLITQWPYFLPDNWRLPRVMGALLTVQDLGVGVVWCAEDSYSSALHALANRNRDDVRLKPRRAAVTMTREEQILASLPGIADGRARALLEHCGNVADALTFLTTGGGGQVPGIGKTTREAVRAALGVRDGFGLWQIPDEDAKGLEK